MKTLLSLVLILLVTATAHAAGPPYAPATLTEVNAGANTYKAVTPYTLANTTLPLGAGATILNIWWQTNTTAANSIKTTNNVNFAGGLEVTGNLTAGGTFIGSGAGLESIRSLRLTAGSATLTNGQVNINSTGKNIGVHNGTREVALSLIEHREFSFDPKAVCDGAVDRLFLFQVGAWAPNGITVTGWRVSFEADPTTEVDLDLKRADAFIGVANSAVMDALDTTSGASSETTAANINSGAVVANGKVVYLEFGTAYSETTHQVIFEIEYEIEED